jgi:hypothetical protein
MSCSRPLARSRSRGLEAELQPEFNLTRRAEGVNAGFGTYPNNVVPNGVSSVDLSDGSVNNPFSVAGGRIKVPETSGKDLFRRGR